MATAIDALGEPSAMQTLLPLMNFPTKDCTLSNLGKYPYAESFAFLGDNASARGRIVALFGGIRSLPLTNLISLYTRTVSGTPCYAVVTNTSPEAAQAMFARIVRALEDIGSIGPRDTLREVALRITAAVSEAARDAPIDGMTTAAESGAPIPAEVSAGLSSAAVPVSVETAGALPGGAPVADGVAAIDAGPAAAVSHPGPNLLDPQAQQSAMSLGAESTLAVLEVAVEEPISATSE